MAKASTKWEEGQSGNPNGRPPGKVSKPISPLRKTLRKLVEMEDKALENIKKAVEGSNIEKAQLETSKWVVGSVASLTRAALQDEELRWKIKNGESSIGTLEDEEEQPNPPPTEGNVVQAQKRFASYVPEEE